MVKIKGKPRAVLLFIAVVILLNLAGNFFYTRFDFTGDKRFTLASKTDSVLKSSEKEIVVTVFLGGAMPAPFKRLLNATDGILNDFKAAASGQVKIVYEDPLADRDAAGRDQVINQLLEIGIEPTSVRITSEEGYAEKLVFPMAMISSGDKQIPVKLLQNFDAGGDYEQNINSSISNLEYTLVSAISKVQSGKNPMIGFTNGNGELSNVLLQDAFKTLSDSYLLSLVDLNVISKPALDELSMLVIAKPKKPFTEAEKYKLNYFVRKGGNLVWSIDQVTAELDSLFRRPAQLAFNNTLNLDDMLFEYGVRINYNLIADANSATIPLASGSGAAAQIQPVLWPYYPILQPDTVVNLVKNIDGIKSQFASTIDTVGNKSVKKTVILKSSPYSLIFNTPTLVSLSMASEQIDPKRFTGQAQTMGVLLEGVFPDIFAGRSLPSGIMEPWSSGEGKPAKMVVVGDGDVFKNEVSTRDGSVFALGYDRFSQRSYGNKAFLLNVADYLTSTDNLITLRGKAIQIRLLDKTKLRAEKTRWQLINIGAPLLLLVFVATFQHYYRRYKYAK